MLNEEAHYRTVSMEREIPFEHYIRIDNAALTAEEAALKIKDVFNL